MNSSVHGRRLERANKAMIDLIEERPTRQRSCKSICKGKALQQGIGAKAWEVEDIIAWQPEIDTSILRVSIHLSNPLMGGAG